MMLLALKKVASGQQPITSQCSLGMRDPCKWVVPEPLNNKRDA